jgi:integrase
MDAGSWREGVFYAPVKASVLDTALRRNEELVPDSLRHIFGTLQLRSGRPSGQVRAIMGHASEKVTTDLYGSSTALDNDGAADDF